MISQTHRPIQFQSPRFQARATLSAASKQAQEDRQEQIRLKKLQKEQDGENLRKVLAEMNAKQAAKDSLREQAQLLRAAECKDEMTRVFARKAKEKQDESDEAIRLQKE